MKCVFLDTLNSIRNTCPFTLKSSVVLSKVQYDIMVDGIQIPFATFYFDITGIKYKLEMVIWINDGINRLQYSETVSSKDVTRLYSSFCSFYSKYYRNLSEKLNVLANV